MTRKLTTEQATVMGSRGGKAKWAKLSPHERSLIMKKVRKGNILK